MRSPAEKIQKQYAAKGIVINLAVAEKLANRWLPSGPGGGITEDEKHSILQHTPDSDFADTAYAMGYDVAGPSRGCFRVRQTADGKTWLFGGLATVLGRTVDYLGGLGISTTPEDEE
ncbi:MAG: hypothetical protein A2W35_06685 [Chloroflexi bacterium RBG_16_57_11]|nr:MAG: hypothetical protein A2W35_06685 [Chloroflexi bacterium RBG_16_57_11]